MIRSLRAASLARSFSLQTTRTTASLARRTTLESRNLERHKPFLLGVARYRPLTTSLKRLDGPYDKIDKKHEDKVEQEKIIAHPDQVSSTSSVHQVFHEQGVPDQEQDVDMLAEFRSDMKAVKATFALDEVPREALTIGLAGVLPYLATSASTLYLAWDINHASITGEGFLVSGPTAEALLHIIEPLQIGYGAVILSFLGAIHWGLEFAKYGGEVGYRRYAYGVIAPAIAWPTILFPVEYALISQFCAFTFFYFADANAVVRGWAPSWYSTYRFVLTFVVGASIVISLVGRGQIADKINRLPSPADRVKRLRDVQYEAAEEEQKYMMEKKARGETDEDEVDEDEEEEDED